MHHVLLVLTCWTCDLEWSKANNRFRLSNCCPRSASRRHWPKPTLTLGISWKKGQTAIPFDHLRMTWRKLSTPDASKRPLGFHLWQQANCNSAPGSRAVGTSCRALGHHGLGATSRGRSSCLALYVRCGAHWLFWRLNLKTKHEANFPDGGGSKIDITACQTTSHSIRDCHRFWRSSSWSNDVFLAYKASVFAPCHVSGVV